MLAMRNKLSDQTRKTRHKNLSVLDFNEITMQQQET